MISKMHFIKYLCVITILFLATLCKAQHLTPGFDAKEYIEMLGVFEGQYNTVSGMLPSPADYKKSYRSPELGLKNQWELWTSRNNVAVISLRGTTADPLSWMENFYAAMVPAAGSLKIDDSTTFNYKVAARPDAMVHVGWLTGLAFMAPGIIEKIKECYAGGTKEFIIAGHSQGGALAFLLRSYLFYLCEQKELPRDLVFKTYCSAAPKPGNLYYAYDYDYITRNGWGFTVVNASDWVPETPFTIQTLKDFNPANPFINAPKALKKLPLLPRIVLKGKYNKMDRATRKAERKLRKSLGNFVYKQIRRSKTQLQQPIYNTGMNYMRAGSPIILMPDEEYKAKYPDDPAQVFRHHLLAPYYLLARKYLVPAN